MNDNQSEVMFSPMRCEGTDSTMVPRRKSNEMCTSRNVTFNPKFGEDTGESSDDRETVAITGTKRHIGLFTESDSDSGQNNVIVDNHDISNNETTVAGETLLLDTDTIISKNPLQKSRIRTMSSSSGSDSDSFDISSCKTVKKNEDQSRIKGKRNMLRQKFKTLITSRLKESETANSISIEDGTSRNEHYADSSDNEASDSVENIKKMIQEKTNHLKMSICDPDTSDEDSSPPQRKLKQKKQIKTIKMTSPKPIRMSAKEASENMQKIKSESNRMLREKEVSLPYHRPKALSLKDIMSRRRPAVTSDGKALPIKMNEEQLKHYALQLEQRQKEMMELCKSDTDEEEISDHEAKIDIDPCMNDTIYDNLINANEENIAVVVTDNVSNKPALPVDINSAQNLMSENSSSDVHNLVTTVDLNEQIEQIPSIQSNPTILKLNAQISEENTSSMVNLSSYINETSILDTKEDGDASKKIIYNDSVVESDLTADLSENVSNINTNQIYGESENSEQQNLKAGTELDSQMISLHYDSERIDSNTENFGVSDNMLNALPSKPSEDAQEIHAHTEKNTSHFSDDDINMEEIDNLIENSEIITSQSRSENSPMLIKERPLKTKPTLTGAPGMIVDLDGTDPFAANKLTGVELLKERFMYFANLKTPEERERQREKRIKPGTQHWKLKLDLEEKIAEQRSHEWAKRLEEEKQQKMELDTIRGDTSEGEEDIDKIEAKLEENENIDRTASSSSESEEEEEEIINEEKPRKRNPMIADEAEESDCDEYEDGERNGKKDNEGVVYEDDEDSDEQSNDEESEEEQENQLKHKKGRILKAFEDSDDEDVDNLENRKSSANTEIIDNENQPNVYVQVEQSNVDSNHLIKHTQDDELQLAQRHKSFSDDLFTSHESTIPVSNEREKTNENDEAFCNEFGTQTFSILNSDVAKENIGLDFPITENFAGMTNTQMYEEGNLDHVVGMCSGSFSQSVSSSQFPITQPQIQNISGDVLALCTGKFYDNQFVSMTENDDKEKNMLLDASVVNNDVNNEASPKTTENSHNGINSEIHQENTVYGLTDDINIVICDNNNRITNTSTQDIPELNQKILEEKNLLNSILDELKDPELNAPKLHQYFNGKNSQNKENKPICSNNQLKKRLVIDSDDEGNEVNNSQGVKKKLKKKKHENRALLISDDEEEQQSDLEEVEDSEAEEEDGDINRIVEYDSEENEVEVKVQDPKKKRKVADFFEQEAELTSEDEWVGSGDEDEAGLDRMEREAGDDDTFHQGRLQRELEQIHMRDVLDQDKREVRLLQELLFEDGDLGDGHRQRKFRWRNADGEEETDATYNEFDTQEEEFESEEQWRKQRHEREMFLKQMQNQNEPESPNVTVNRSSIIKANLSSKTMSTLLSEVSTSNAEKTETSVTEKKTSKDIPSPATPFSILQSYHGSLLTRGHGALARLAALATPLAAGEDAPKGLAPTGKRNFVFAAVTPDEEQPKVIKRKAASNPGTPMLMKKIKTEEKRNQPKSSLLDHL